MTKKTPVLFKGQTVSLVVDSLATGGDGVSRYKDFVVFTPFSCPGDQIEAKIILLKKNFAKAELINIVKASPERLKPKCPVFYKCGGCTWQHVSYKEQLKQKQNILISALTKTNILNADKIKNIVASPKQWNYRNRIQIKIDKQNNYGFYQRQSNNLVSIKNCPISEDQLFKNLDQKILKLSLNKNQKITYNKSAHLEAELYISANKEVKLTQKSNTLAKNFAFSQVNQELNKILIQDILKHLKNHLLKNENIYDLYCGQGNFTFPIQKFCKPKQSIGVESNLDSVNKANKNIKENNLSDIYFLQKNVKCFLQNCKTLNGPVVLDPPRVGCEKEVLFLLKKLQAKVILYISCNPQSLARDLNILKGENQNYKVILSQAYDMFPQTDHVESLSIIVKTS